MDNQSAPNNINMPNNNMQNPQPLNKNLAMICATIVLLCAIVSVSVLYANSQKTAGPTNNQPTNNQPTNNQPTGPVKVSMDDDAVLGSVTAPVTMIEFSDYECPFCKRHFMEVFPDIKKDYIDTGKLKLVFRDLIAVPSHNPLATSQAMAAQCAKELGGDSAYFKYHDALFAKTTSNGSGMLLSDLPVLAKNIGLNVTTFNQCVASNKYKDEVAKDNADGLAVLPSPAGTPSFFVGKSSADGTINGNVVVGAQPYSVFKAAIEAALNAK